MFVRIESDILKDACSGQFPNISLRVLHEAAIAVSRGKHYIFIPEFNKYKDKLSQYISPFVLNVLKGIKMQNANSLQQKITYFLVITNEIPENKNPHVIYLSPQECPSFELHEESHLICENLTDCEFYSQIRKYYLNTQIPRPLRTLSCRMLYCNGGGATTINVIEREIEQTEHLCLVITDSDQKFENGPLSENIIAINNLCKKNKSGLVLHYYLQECREVENLIPLHLLQHPNRCHKAEEIVRKKSGINYMDIKEGIRLEALYDDEIYNYWDNIVTSYGLSFSISERNPTRWLSRNKKEYKQKCSERPDKGIIVDGWGNSILKTVIDNSKDSTNLRDIKSTQLEPYQHRNWVNIGKLIFEWGLACKPGL